MSNRDKQKPYFGKYNTLELVDIMLEEIDLTRVSTNEDYHSQQCQPSHKKISFFRNDDDEKNIINGVKVVHIKSGSSRGLQIKW
jgi:hypothetical protein